MKKSWSKIEVKTLKTNYATMGRDELEKLLPRRTWPSIRIYASNLKLSRKIRSRVKKPEDEVSELDKARWNWRVAQYEVNKIFNEPEGGARFNTEEDYRAKVHSIEKAADEARRKYFSMAGISYERRT